MGIVRGGLKRDDMFYCEITRLLDKSFKDGVTYERYRSYMIFHSNVGSEEIYAIRVPGMTVGSMSVVDKVIKSVKIAECCLDKVFRLNANELIAGFVGDTFIPVRSLINSEVELCRTNE